MLAIPQHSDDRVRAFRTHRHRELHFATLIEPPRRASTAPEAGRRRDSSLAPLEALANDDPTMRDTLTRAARLRNEPIYILVIGETGTGKERMARALHYALATGDGNEVVVGDLPEECLTGQLAHPGAGRPIALTSENTTIGQVSTATPRTLEQDLLYRALCRHQWNVSAVARELGLSRPTIYRRMKRLGIVPPNRQMG